MGEGLRLRGREAPAEIVYEDDVVVVFPDTEPSAPIHLLIVPKEHVPDLETLSQPELPNHVMQTAKKLADSHGGPAGYRVAVNSSKLADIDHLHFHFWSGPTKASILGGGDSA